MGYSNISEQLLNSSNHSYTRNNIGIYLKPYNAIATNSKSSILTQKIFQSDCTNSDGELQFMENGQFTLQLMTWNHTDDSEVENRYQGTWEKHDVNDQNEVLLRFDSYSIILTVQSFITRYSNGTVSGINLLNTNHSEPIPDCDFILILEY